MSAGQCKHVPLRSNKFEFSGSRLDGPPSKSAASMLIEIGVMLAEAAFATPTPGLCFHCRNYKDARSSTAENQNLFCSQQCEREFVRRVLASVTLEECIRTQERLEALLVGARQAYRMNCGRGLNKRSGRPCAMTRPVAER